MHLCGLPCVCVLYCGVGCLSLCDINCELCWFILLCVALLTLPLLFVVALCVDLHSLFCGARLLVIICVCMSVHTCLNNDARVHPYTYICVQHLYMQTLSALVSMCKHALSVCVCVGFVLFFCVARDGHTWHMHINAHTYVYIHTHTHPHMHTHTYTRTHAHTPSPTRSLACKWGTPCRMDPTYRRCTPV